MVKNHMVSAISLTPLIATLPLETPTSFYERHGFRLVGPEREGPPTDHLLKYSSTTAANVGRVDARPLTPTAADIERILCDEGPFDWRTVSSLRSSERRQGASRCSKHNQARIRTAPAR